MQNGQHVQEEKVKRPRGRKQYSKKVRAIVITAISLMCVMSFALIGGGVYLWVVFSRFQYDTNTNSASYIDSLPPDDEDTDMSNAVADYTVIDNGASKVADIPVKGDTKSIKNYLFLGIDNPDAGDFSGRSDSTMIVTINSKDKTIKLTSILRDTMVTIPGRDKNGDGKDDYAKFNASWAYGGFDLLSKTIEQNFRLKIDKYIAVNFNAFAKAVDAMGGVDMAMTGAEANVVGCGSSDATYHLTGEQALNYSRIRHLDSDFGRTNRQRKMITALFGVAKTMDIGKLNSVLMNVAPQVRTNMTMAELMGFTANSLTYFSYKIGDTYYLPQEGGYTGKTLSDLGSVLILNDSADSVTKMQEFIYGVN